MIYETDDPRVQIGVWEAGVSVTRLENYPCTEYCLMISGRVVVTAANGASAEAQCR